MSGGIGCGGDANSQDVQESEQTALPRHYAAAVLQTTNRPIEKPKLGPVRELHPLEGMLHGL